MTRLLRLCLALILALPGWAAADDRALPLFQAMGLEELIAIMREEGIGYGRDMEQELFIGQGGPAWAEAVERIYSEELMTTGILRRLDAELAGFDTAPMIAFFSDERGQRIIGLEISARRAMMEDEIEEAARDAFAAMVAEEAPLVARIEAFEAANDLIGWNVTGALNSNISFYTGLNDGGAFGDRLTEENILNDVWSQEPDIRADTVEWVFAYLALAYSPLPPEDLEAYTDFSNSAPGRALNRAVFAAFNGLFDDMSRALGLAAAGFISGEEL